jgi:hypothetical protein
VSGWKGQPGVTTTGTRPATKAGDRSVTDEPKQYFTVRAVEALIPRLESVMGRVMDAHARAAKFRTALEGAQREVVLAGGTRLLPEWWRARRVGIDKANRELRTGLEELLATGGVPKDLELGLVDFLGHVKGREVNLCWRYGEKKIRFWHGLDEGFGGRKAIPESEMEA